MTLPPLNTPIPHDGSATCPVHGETFVEAATLNDLYLRSARNVYWPDVTTYTIIARAPADEIAALQAQVAELEGALRLAENRIVELYRGIAPNGDFAAKDEVVIAIRAALKGNPNAHD